MSLRSSVSPVRTRMTPVRRFTVEQRPTISRMTHVRDGPAGRPKLRYGELAEECPGQHATRDSRCQQGGPIEQGSAPEPAPQSPPESFHASWLLGLIVGSPVHQQIGQGDLCLLYTSPSPRDR